MSLQPAFIGIIDNGCGGKFLDFAHIMQKSSQNKKVAVQLQMLLSHKIAYFNHSDGVFQQAAEIRVVPFHAAGASCKFLKELWIIENKLPEL